MSSPNRLLRMLNPNLVKHWRPCLGAKSEQPASAAHPGDTECAAPNDGGQASERVQQREHGDGVPDVGALDEAVEGLAGQVPRVAARAHPLQRRLHSTPLYF